MDYRRPTSKRVKNAPARFRSDEENLEKVKERNEKKEQTNNSKTLNRKRKFIEQLADSSNTTEELSRNYQGQEVNLDYGVKGEIL
jgi:hypothetical protein